MTNSKYTLLDQALELPWYFGFYFAIRYYGWLYSIIGIVVIWQIYSRSMKFLFGLEHLSGMDSFWFHDDYRNYANIVAYLRFERFNAEDFRAKIFKNGMKFARNRSKVVKFLGTWWF